MISALILKYINQGHVLSKADPFHSKADRAPVEVEENVLVDS